MESKLLDLHKDKSCFMVFGSSSLKEEAHKTLEMSPIMLYGSAMKEKEQEK